MTAITVLADRTTLARKLIVRAAELAEAVRPIDVKIARARFEGLSEGIHLAGFGATATAVYLPAWEFVRDNPRPAFTALNTARKAWEAVGVTVLAAALSEMAWA